jgi:general secretion pathway protein F
MTCVMAVFRYTALNQAGKQISGEMEAKSRELVIRHLAEAGHFPIDAVAQSTSAAAASSRSLMDFWQSASPTQITQFTRQLAMLLGAGLTLPRAMGLVEGETSGGRVQKIAQQIRADIAVGKSLAEALEARGKQFPPVFVSMVRAAEASGTLPEVLERIAETREREQKMRAKLMSALLYPSLLVVTAIAALLVIMLFVVPRFKSMLVDSGVKLPQSAATVIAVSDWLNAYVTELGIGIALFILGILFLRQRPGVRRFLDRLSLRLPFVSNLIRMDLTIRFCRTLGALLANGVALPTALNLTREVMGNDEAAAVVAAMGQELRKGSDLAKPMEASRLFPPIVIALVRVGEETGGLAKSALYLADMFEEKLDVATQRLVTILEPVIIIAVSVVVAMIVISIMGAVVSVYDLTF